MVQLLGILFTASITVFVGADYPCDTASDYLIKFLQCYNPFGTYVQSLNLNTIYRNYDSTILNAFIPDGWSDTDPDGIRACGEGIEEIRSCMSEAYISCSAEVRVAVFAEIDRYRARLCENRGGTWVWTELSITYFQRIAVGFSSFSTGSLTCISNVFTFGLLEDNTCYTVELWAVYSFMADNSLVALNGRMARLYGAYYSCLYRQMIISQCDNEFAIGYFSYTAIFGFTGVAWGVSDLDLLLTQINVGSFIRRTLGLFGDPHVHGTNGTDGTFTTCSAVGDRIYLSNTFVTVTGTNTALAGRSGEASPPTFTTALTVTFFDETYNAVAVYSAGNTVPTTFTNGQSIITETSTDEQYYARIESMNGAVRLNYTRGGIAISINKAGQGLNMKFRMADNLYKASSGDLIYGCIDSEVDTSQVTRKRRGAPSTICADTGVTDYYLEACEYDLAVTGDDTVVSETYNSLAELDTLVEELDEQIIQTSAGTTAGSGVDALIPNGIPILCLMVAGYIAIL